MAMAMIPLLAPVLAPLAGGIFKIIDRLIPDPVAAERLKMEMMAEMQKSDLAQIEVNKIEAASSHWFVAAARPGFMWLGLFVIAYHGVFIPFAEGIIHFWLPEYKLPESRIVVENMWTLVSGMMGLGAMRSYDKMQGTDTKSVAPAPRDPKSLADKIRTGT